MATRCTDGTFEKRAAIRSFSAMIGVSLNTYTQAAPSTMRPHTTAATIGHALRRRLGRGGTFAWGTVTGRPAAGLGTGGFICGGAGGPVELPGLGRGATVSLVNMNAAWHWGQSMSIGPGGTSSSRTSSECPQVGHLIVMLSMAVFPFT